MTKKKPKNYNPYIRSFQLTKELFETIKGFTSLKFPFPLGEPRNKKHTIRWLEFSMAWFVAAALRKEISNEQVDNCISPSDVLSLWLAFVEAKHGTKGYKFTSNDPKKRKVFTPEGGEPERTMRFGMID